MRGNPRNLPVTVDRLVPVHLGRRLWRKGWAGAGWHNVLLVAGLGLALAGAWLGLEPAPVTAGFSADGYHLDGNLLAPTGPGTYSGAAGLALVRRNGLTRAGGSSVVGGVRVRGLCLLGDDATSERCSFSAGRRNVTAVDARDGAGWLRRYGDGQTVRIALLDGRPAPVPFLVGYSWS